ncbi:MAG TPA: hypothetical protein DIC42_01575 [Holosporales bacterium]|nr:hypothetical protein [Holosporales bacterium]
MNKHILIISAFLLTVSHTYGTRGPLTEQFIGRSEEFHRKNLGLSKMQYIESEYREGRILSGESIIRLKERLNRNEEGLDIRRCEELIAAAVNVTLPNEIRRLARICRTLNKVEGTRDLLLNFEKQRDNIINPFPEDDEHRYVLQQMWDEVYNRPHTPQPAPDIPAAAQAQAQRDLAHILFNHE